MPRDPVTEAHLRAVHVDLNGADPHVSREEAERGIVDALFAGKPMDLDAEPPEIRDPIPGIPFAHPGSCVMLVGPTGRGRSSLAQACAYDAAQHGIRVAFLGSEVTYREFLQRAQKLREARGDNHTDELARQLRENVRYIDLAQIMDYAKQHPDDWVKRITEQVDVVMLDPLGAAQTARNEDYTGGGVDFSNFYWTIVQPLVTADLAVLILENVGHANDDRAPGSATKHTLPDVSLVAKHIKDPEGLKLEATKVRAEYAPFAAGDAWLFDEATRSIVPLQKPATASSEDRGKPTYYMSEAWKMINERPGQLKKSDIANTLKGVAHQTKFKAISYLLAGGHIETRADGTLWPLVKYTAPDPPDSDDSEARTKGPKFSDGSETQGSEGSAQFYAGSDAVLDPPELQGSDGSLPYIKGEPEPQPNPGTRNPEPQSTRRSQTVSTPNASRVGVREAKECPVHGDTKTWRGGDLVCPPCEVMDALAASRERQA